MKCFITPGSYGQTSPDVGGIINLEVHFVLIPENQIEADMLLTAGLQDFTMCELTGFEDAAHLRSAICRSVRDLVKGVFDFDIGSSDIVLPNYSNGTY